jgi:hypothetical protein
MISHLKAKQVLIRMKNKVCSMSEGKDCNKQQIYLSLLTILFKLQPIHNQTTDTNKELVLVRPSFLKIQKRLTLNNQIYWSH